MLLTEYKYPNNEIRCVLTHSRVSRTSSPPVPDSGSARGSESSLDISPEVETVKNEVAPGWGAAARRTVFGRYAIHRLLCAGGAVDKLPGGAGRQVFFTGTLPGSTEKAKSAIAHWSSWMIHGLKAWVNKIVPQKMDFYVWELQKRGALHLHYVVRTETEEQIEKLLSGFKKQWVRLLQRLSERAGCDVFERSWGGSWKDSPHIVQADAQRVRKSVGAYLSCYLKKGHSKHELDRYSQYCPVRWFGISRPLSAVIARMTEKRETDYASYSAGVKSLEEKIVGLEPLSVAGKVFKHQFGLGKTAVYYFNQEEIEEIWQSVKSNSCMEWIQMDKWMHQLMTDTSALYKRCLLNLKHSLPRSKQLLLESVSLGVTQQSGSGLRWNRKNVEALNALMHQFGLNWSMAMTNKNLQEELLLTVRKYWLAQRLAVYRLDGSCENAEEIRQTVDNLVPAVYAGTSPEDGTGEGAVGGDIILDNQHPKIEQLSLFGVYS